MESNSDLLRRRRARLVLTMPHGIEFGRDHRTSPGRPEDRAPPQIGIRVHAGAAKTHRARPRRRRSEFDSMGVRRGPARDRNSIPCGGDAPNTETHDASSNTATFARPIEVKNSNSPPRETSEKKPGNAEGKVPSPAKLEYTLSHPRKWNVRRALRKKSRGRGQDLLR